MTLTFRKAVAADAAIIQPLVKSAYRGDSSRKGWTTEADLLNDERISEASVVDKINNPDGAILLAYDEASQLAACCEVASKGDGIGYFGLFAVDPDRQAGGFGKLVLAEAERYFKESLDVKTIEMWVIWTRKELIEWYLRRGYVMTDRKQEFPYGQLVNGAALRDDLHFVILTKDI